jgi:hypothetical protein
MQGRALIESRFGPLGKGAKQLLINDADYDLAAIMFRLDLQLEDVRVFDAVQVAANHYAVRYYDGQDQRVVAQEFDSAFRYLGETRAHIAEWIGDDAYFDSMRPQPFRCPLVPGDDF